MDALSYIREENEPYSTAKVHRDPRLKKMRDARGSRRQNRAWMNLVPGMAVHHYGPITGIFGLTHNGIPYWKGRGHTQYHARAASRPRCFKKNRKRNGRVSYLGQGGTYEWSQPEQDGKSSRTHMRQQAYWRDVAFECLSLAAA